MGLGAMGSRMARRLLDTGLELTVWNRDAAKAAPLVGAGAGAAATPAEAAASAEVVIVMVRDPEALSAVSEGTDGIAAGLREGSTVIQMSTVGPAAVERLARMLPPGSLLDAPVLGSLGEAEDGTLKIFAAGDEETLARWTSLLSTLGTVFRVGPVGAGSAAKLVANATLVGVVGVLGEALALADALGLAPDTAFEVLATTPLAAQAERRRPAFESGEYSPRFPVSLARKDADLILEVLGGARVVAAGREWLAEAEAHGRGDDDYSAVIAEIVERLKS